MRARTRVSAAALLRARASQAAAACSMQYAVSPHLVSRARAAARHGVLVAPAAEGVALAAAALGEAAPAARRASEACVAAKMSQLAP